MKPRRQLILGLGASALAAPLAPFAQEASAKPARIGFLGLASAADWASRVDALRAGLRDFGYVEGKNIVIEFRWAEGKYDRLAGLAAELVRLKVDVLVAHSTPGSLAAKRATGNIPIVMAHSGDAVATGIVASLARPGGNITGSTFFDPELMAKKLELLKEAFPQIRQVAVLVNVDNPQFGPILKAMASTAQSLKVALKQFRLRQPSEFAGAFAAMAKERVDAVVIDEDAMFSANVAAIAEHAARHRLRSAGGKAFAEAGGLIGYGVNFLELYRRAAYFVDRILKGAKPADLPIEQATKFEMVVNRRTATALGITLSPELLLRADKVIE